MKTKIVIVGMDNFGKAILSRLLQLDNMIVFSHLYHNGEASHLDLGGNDVNVVDLSELRKQYENKKLIRFADVIVVNLPGPVLEKEIDFLLDLDVPLVICSTGYNVEMVKQKAEDAFVSVIMSENFALPVLKFWQQIQNLKKLPDDFIANVHIVENHEQCGRDVSASSINVMKLFAEKGFPSNMPDVSYFSNGKSVTSGSLTSIRNRKESRRLNVPEQFLNSHSYQRIFLQFDTKGINEHNEYAQYLYEHFKKLEQLSIEGVFEFNVQLVKNGIKITCNTNGLDSYVNGVVKAIIFIDTAINDRYTGYTLLD